MVFETEKFEVIFLKGKKFNIFTFEILFICFQIQNILIESVESRNEHQFQYILDELRLNPNKKRKCFYGLSTFERVLLMPNSKKFIERCIYNGSDFYKVI